MGENSWDLLKQENEILKHQLKLIKEHIYKFEKSCFVDRKILLDDDKHEWVLKHSKRSLFATLGHDITSSPFVTITDMEEMFERKFTAEIYIYKGKPFWT